MINFPRDLSNYLELISRNVRCLPEDSLQKLLFEASERIKSLEHVENDKGPTRVLFGCGEKVLVGGVMHGVVEEVIFVRNMATPLYLVEWWHEGDLRCRRFHESDLEVAQ